MTIGRAAPAMAAMIESAAAGSSAAGDDSAGGSGQPMAPASTRSSSRSDGRLTCTGPGRPEVAIRIASPMSRPSAGRGVRGPRRLGHRRRHVGLAQLLETAAAELPGRGMTGQQHHRRFRAERREQRADGVGVAGSAGHQRNAGLAGEPAVGVRHVDRGGLVAHMHEIETGVERGVEDRHDVVARKREDAPAPQALERAGDDVGAAQRLAHDMSLRESFSAGYSMTSSARPSKAEGTEMPIVFAARWLRDGASCHLT